MVNIFNVFFQKLELLNFLQKRLILGGRYIQLLDRLLKKKKGAGGQMEANKSLTAPRSSKYEKTGKKPLLCHTNLIQKNLTVIGLKL